MESHIGDPHIKTREPSYSDYTGLLIPDLEDVPKHSAVNYLPAEEVLRWIKEGPGATAVADSEILPKTLDQETGGRLTRLFIEEFCDDDRMASSLFVHFHMGGWTGSESDYLSRKRDAARQWLKEISSVKIQLWLGKYIDSFK